MSEIHIQIKIAGAGSPSAAELELRDALEDELTEREIGEVVKAGGGAGYMDVFLKAKNHPRALASIRLLVAKLGLAANTKIDGLAASAGDQPGQSGQPAPSELKKRAPKRPAK